MFLIGFKYNLYNQLERETFRSDHRGRISQTVYVCHDEEDEWRAKIYVTNVINLD